MEKIMNNVAKKPTNTDNDVEKKIFIGRIFIDLLVFVGIFTVTPIIILLIANNKKLQHMSFVKWLEELPSDWYYILSFIGALIIIYWHIKTNSIKNFNDSILTIITSIAALKIFSTDGSFLSALFLELNSDPITLLLFKQITVTCGFAKFGISLYEFSKDRIKYLKGKYQND